MYLRIVMRFLVLALGLVAGSAVAADADQFDLVCTSETGASQRYRIDLSKGEACTESCDRVWKMGPATTGELKVIDKVPARDGDVLEEQLVVNRQTGEYRYHNRMPGFRTARGGGICEVAPFSGFPSAKF